jgi:hypothetical protein
MARHFIRAAALWLVAGVVLGAYMGATHDHADKQLHVHGLLLGWASCAIFAVAYAQWEVKAAASWTQFWLHNVGLIALLGGLALQARARTSAALLATGSMALVCSAALFLLLIWRASASPRVPRN